MCEIVEICSREKPAFDQNLKTVADTKHQLARFDEPNDLFAETVPELKGVLDGYCRQRAP